MISDPNLDRPTSVVRTPHPAPDAAVDVVVAGSGAAAFSAALHAAGAGAEVLMLERGERVGGTTYKSHGWFWMPDNRFMREAGIPDPKPQALQYMARLSRPQLYRADHATLGLPADEYALIAAFYDHAAETVESLLELDALEMVHGVEVPDYYDSLDEDVAPYGRALMPKAPDGGVGYGNDMIGQLTAAAQRLGIQIRAGHRVRQVLQDDDGRVVGVVAEHDGAEVVVTARRGVVFGTGGFGASDELTRNYLPGPTFGGCCATTNTGDLIQIAGELGAPLRNMNQAWYSTQTIEKWFAAKDTGDPDYMSLFSPPGDSMVWVNRFGRRVVNEKGIYNEIGPSFWAWDPKRGEWPNLLLLMIWDQPCNALFAGAPNRADNPISPEGASRDHIIEGESLEALAAAIGQRLARIAHRTGGVALDADFVATLRATLERFNAFAAQGKDPDFRRGEHPFEAMLQAHNGGPARPGNEDSPVLHPLSMEGPYFCCFVGPGTLDTKGGPRINTQGQILDAGAQPIPGLYGAGNCVSSPAARAYWGAGGTIGPALVFGRQAGLHAAAMVPRDAALGASTR